MIEEMASRIRSWETSPKILRPCYASVDDWSPGKSERLILDSIAALKSCKFSKDDDLHQWCRFLTPEYLTNAQTLSQGLYIKDLYNREFVKSSYLWDTAQLPCIQAENTHGLPSGNNVFDAVHPSQLDPIRMRFVNLAEDVVAISGACSFWITFSLHVHTKSSNDRIFYQRTEDIYDAPDLTWIHYVLDEQEKIVDVDVVGTRRWARKPDSPLQDAHLVLHTSSGRQLAFGPHLPPYERSHYSHHRLVNNAHQEPSGVFLNERRAWQAIRVGVTTRAASAEHPKPPIPWAGQLPEDRIHERIWSTPCFRSRLNPLHFESFQTCTQSWNGMERCLGVRFSGHGRVRILGQWRADATISDDYSLPSDMLLAVKRSIHMPIVVLAPRGAKVASTRGIALKGEIEWQSCPDGDTVHRVHGRPRRAIREGGDRV